jgi:hypothetical protein
VAPATEAPAVPSPPTGVVAIDPAAAGLAIVAATLAVALTLLARKVLRRGRSAVGL